MSRTALGRLRLVGPFAAAAALGLGSLPALAQSTPAMVTADCSAIHFDLANPGPGARVEQGTDLLSGVAVDKRAGDGVGIDRVDFFLDSRESGGINIGTASPATVPGPLGPGSFQASVSFPSNVTGGHDLVAYAHSAVTGQESVIDVPIVLGEDPSKVAEPTNLTATQTCTGGGTGGATTTPMTPPSGQAPPATTTTTTSTTAPMASAGTTPASTTAMMAPGASTITLEVGNPSPGDTVHVGAMNIDGMAWDKAATAPNTGIDRIDIFLDNRDAGGILLTQATLAVVNNTWHATPTLPSNQTGLHTLVFYAHSSVTGQETSVSVPVTIAP